MITLCKFLLEKQLYERKVWVDLTRPLSGVLMVMVTRYTHTHTYIHTHRKPKLTHAQKSNLNSDKHHHGDNTGLGFQSDYVQTPEMFYFVACFQYYLKQTMLEP